MIKCMRLFSASTLWWTSTRLASDLRAEAMQHVTGLLCEHVTPVQTHRVNSGYSRKIESWSPLMLCTGSSGNVQLLISRSVKSSLQGCMQQQMSQAVQRSVHHFALKRRRQTTPQRHESPGTRYNQHAQVVWEPHVGVREQSRLNTPPDPDPCQQTASNCPRPPCRPSVPSR